MANGSASVRASLAMLAPAVRSGLASRVDALLPRLAPSGGQSGRGQTGSGLAALAATLPGRDTAELWLTYSVVSARFPRPTEVRRLRRLLELDGGWAAIASLLHGLPHRYDPRFRPAPVAFATGLALDVTGLAAPGVNDEGREAGRRLLREWGDRVTLPVVWAADGRTLRGLSAEECDALDLAVPAVSLAGSVVIPSAGYALLGTADLPRNAERLIALGQYAGFPTASVGYGIGPLVHGERYATTEGAERFTWHLAAQRSFERLVAVGADTPRQYSGWKRMLTAVGIPGPDIIPIALPAEPSDPAWRHFADDCATAIGLG